MKCINCGEEGPHFVAPSFGELGFYTCALQPVETCEHCHHYHDWPMAEGQEEPNGDPGDGLGVQGVCCDCGKEQAA